MCGIFGAYNQTNRTPLEGQAFKKALHEIKHRGPDAQLYKVIQPDVGLGHNRLSIIDLQEASNQPFEYEHLSLVFNGEIFNYQALRQELSILGYSFRTASDTEVIPAAYLHWGTDCVNHFNGMWAFVIYDHKQDILFCSRDRFGIKPFNYSFLNGRFVFSSEVKAMLAFDQPTYQETNYNAVSRYCRETVGAQASETWFEGVFRLPPAHNLIVTRNNHEFFQYWNYPTKIDTEITYEEAQSEYLRLFEDSIKLRLRSDVPLGLTLSGGLDSASIACKVKQLEQNARTFNTYTASFPGYPFDEYPIAKDLSDQLGMHSVEIQLDYSTYLSSLEKIVYHLESGHGSPAIFPLWNITKRAKEDITVFLEGQGADELLGGYVNSIFIDRLIDLVKTGQWNTAIKEVQAHRTTWPIKQTILLYLRQELPASLRKSYRRYNGLESIYSDQLSMHKPFEVDYSTFNTSSALTKRLFTQHTTGLVNLLHYGDAISMAHSLENRLPFMDYRLVEFVFSLPSHYKIQGNVGKKIHRDVMHDIVPSKITNNHNKLGFVSPLKQIFSEEKYGAIDLLLDESMPCADLFIRDRLLTLLKEHKEGKLNHERILFKVLSTKLWGKNYKTSQVTSVIVVQTILPHYRASFFERLTAIDELDVKVVAGEGQEVATFSPSSNRILTVLENKKINIKGHVFVYQKGLVSLLWREKPDHVVFGGPDVHVFSTFWAFFVLKLLTRTNIHWWTHGINKKSKLLRAFQRFFLVRSSSAMTYELEGQQDILTAMSWSAEKVTVLKNAINTKDYGLLRDNEKDKTAPLGILFAGRLTPAKRCDLLIKAAKHLKDANISFKVEIIGDGSELNTCKSLVDNLELNDYVVFHGAKYGDEVVAIFSRADIFVLPGKVGLSALHALSYGLPVLTTDQDIHSPEIALIQKGYNGGFFHGLSEESLAIKIQEWMNILKEDNESVRGRVKKSVQLAGYTPEAMVDEFVKHFRNLV